jgi:hypothetical protein
MASPSTLNDPEQRVLFDHVGPLELKRERTHPQQIAHQLGLAAA